MDGHFIYSRPAVVTEDKIKEALAKQANQRALKAALDQQVLESERLKAEAHRAKGRKAKRALSHNNSRGSTASAPSPAPDENAEQKSNPNSGAKRGPSPSPPTSSPGAHAGPSSTIAPTRYTFSFKEGCGTFEKTDSSVRQLEDTLQPSSVESRAGAGSGDGSRSVSPSNVKEKRRNAPLPARGTQSSRGSARETTGSAGGSGTNSRVKRKVNPKGGEYQTNSLPANFKLGKDVAGSRPSRCTSRERGSGASTDNNTNNSSSGGGYDTQSLPVELIYKLSQGGAPSNAAGGGGSSGGGAANVLSRLKPPHPPRLTSPKRSPSTSRVSDSLGGRSPLSPQSAQPGSPGSAVRERSLSVSPRSEDCLALPLVSPRGGKSGRMNAPLDGAGGGRPSARPAGGILPPLNAPRDPDVIEMSAILNTRTCTPPHDNGVPRRRTNSTPKDRSPLPSGAVPLGEVNAAELARKQAEREKGWAQQVKQLKAELRKARQKVGSGRVAGGGKAGETLDKAPRRAETAPDPPAHPSGKAPRGVAGMRQHRAEGGGENVGPTRPTRLEKMDFSKAHIFSRETFRPITAPEDAASYFGGLLGSPAPAPRTPLPLVQPKPSSPSASAFTPSAKVAAAATPSSPAESDLQTQKTATQSSSHTATSGEESLKLASLTTRQVMLGLPNYGDGAPVPIQFMHLRQFVEAQIITANQAENLWDFFALSVPAELGGSGGGGGGGHFPEDVAAGDGDGNDAGEEPQAMESHTIEVAAEVSRGRASPSPHHDERGSRGDDENAEEEGSTAAAEEEEDDDDFFIPHSPSHPPANAVLAPALRRKISQMHSEEAALFLQHQQQIRNGRQRPGAVSDANAANVGEKDVVMRDEQSQVVTPKRRPDADDSEPEGTFDTYSELKLSRNVLSGDGTENGGGGGGVKQGE